MKDVRIVIVSWNVADQVVRCVESLSAACDGLDWEVVVVDNGSIDETVEQLLSLNDDSQRASRQNREVHSSSLGTAGLRANVSTIHELSGGIISKNHTPLRVIGNKENRGFARACNQGIAGADAQYVLLLNPDTICPEGTITKFVQEADRYPQVGIFGPKLKNEDGTHQPSVRSFPRFWDQAGILLKLHRLLPFLPVFKNYFSPKTQGENFQLVDQVMGAAFLIRKELVDEIGGLDERYFVWFEEVDFCKTAKEHGWPTAYLPNVSITHVGGTAFAQIVSVRKQRFWSTSMTQYFQKWHPGWRARMISFLRPVSVFLARAVQFLQKNPWAAWMLLIVLFEVISRLTVFHPMARACVTIAAGGLMALLAFRAAHIGLLLLFLELLIGSKGALVKIPLGWEVDGGYSLRIVMTGAFLAAWGVSFLRDVTQSKSVRHWVAAQLKDRARWPWFALAVMILHGGARGFLLGQERLFQDVNAWLFIALLVPTLYVARTRGIQLLTHGKDVVVAALLWLPVKTLALLYIWSHGIKSQSQAMYFWIRRTGVGEVTLVTGNLFRVFIQSQVYAIAGILFSGANYLSRGVKKLDPGLNPGWKRFWILTASLVSILVSLSRSFWLGLAAGLITLVVLYGKRLKTTFLKTIGVGFISFGVAVGIIAAVVSIPVPPVDVGSLSTLFGSRGSTGDAAAVSRWNLLPVLWEKIGEAPILGHGFGATVTYETRDPRILAQNPDGMYTTHAFEWGWLEHWVKLGILGIPVMLWVLGSLIYRFWKLNDEWWVRAGWISSLVALGTLHIFTPYLNHPLGLGSLLAAEGYLEAKRYVSRIS